ncbi:hypothetical protein DL93DRAFT_2095989 [Clavulina sp. PMI_390]|nr:hypothetical protein DL93DRAFT_2095989 [Clavulina sp. PMI_390]
MPETIFPNESDAKRPCSTCIKAHAHHIAPLCARGEPFEPRPTCTYDEDPQAAVDEEQPVTSGDPPPGLEDTTFGLGSSFEETLLTLSVGMLKKHSEIPIINFSDRERRIYSYEPGAIPMEASIRLSDLSPEIYPTLQSTAYGSLPRSSGSGLNSLRPPPSDGYLGTAHLLDPATPSNAASTPSTSSNPAPHTQQTSLIASAYAPTLPPPHLVEHLVDIFFSSVPYSRQILHRPSFLASLRSVPGSSEYPSATLLHALCAVSSLFSPLIERPIMPDFKARVGYEIFLPRKVLEEENKLASGISIAFSLQQAVYARAMIDLDTRTGKQVVIAATSMLMMTWYYYQNARWADLTLLSGTLIRACISLGLNCSGHYNTFSNPRQLESLNLSDNSNPAETERLRNLFWAAYIFDRHEQIGTGWTPSILDEDISQELPARYVDYEAGLFIPGPRQHLSDPDIFTNHPPHLTDSWVLSVKAFCLLGRISTFNRRLELHRRGEVNDLIRPSSEMFYPVLPECDGLRQDSGYDRWYNSGSSPEIVQSTTFRMLDSQITGFRLSIPPEYRNPIKTDAYTDMGRGAMGRSRLAATVDTDTFIVHNILQAAVILLHGPHIDIRAAESTHRDKSLAAARALIDTIHELSATSFDPMLLPRPVIGFWTCGVNCMSLFWCHAIVEGRDEEAKMYKSEIDVVINMIGYIAHKSPLAYKEKHKLLESLKRLEKFALRKRKSQQTPHVQSHHSISRVDEPGTDGEDSHELLDYAFTDVYALTARME